MLGFAGHWKGLSPQYSHTPIKTGVSYENLRTITNALTRVPRDFAVHPKLARLLDIRRKEMEERQPILGVRRGIGVRLAAARRHVGASERSGQPARHV